MSQYPYRYHQQRRRERERELRRRKRVISLGIFSLLTVILLIIALIYSLSSAPPAVPSTSEIVVITANSPQPQRYVPPAVGPYDEEGIPLLLTPNRAVPADYTYELADIGSGYQMDSRAAVAYNAMQSAAAQENIYLTPLSAWRSAEKQTNNYNASVQNYLAQGYSQEEAERLTRRYYALPGTSEHEVGLAVDINSLEDTFENTEAFAWLQQHCIEYGFILRYHKETEAITGIAYEPWHYRYVGTNHAKAMQNLGYNTLEEYVAMLEEQEAL